MRKKIKANYYDELLSNAENEQKLYILNQFVPIHQYKIDQIHKKLVNAKMHLKKLVSMYQQKKSELTAAKKSQKVQINALNEQHYCTTITPLQLNNWFTKEVNLLELINQQEVNIKKDKVLIHKLKIEIQTLQSSYQQAEIKQQKLSMILKELQKEVL